MEIGIIILITMLGSIGILVEGMFSIRRDIDDLRKLINKQK